MNNLILKETTPMSTKAKLALLKKLIDERDKLVLHKLNAILRGETHIADCPECVTAEARWERLYQQFVEAIS
jgi:hypothetical protein